MYAAAPSENISLFSVFTNDLTVIRIPSLQGIAETIDDQLILQS